MYDIFKPEIGFHITLILDTPKHFAFELKIERVTTGIDLTWNHSSYGGDTYLNSHDIKESTDPVYIRSMMAIETLKTFIFHFKKALIPLVYYSDDN